MTITEERRSVRITDGMRKCTFFSFTSSSWNNPAKNSVDPAQTPWHHCRTFPLLFAQMGMAASGLVNVAKKIKR